MFLINKLSDCLFVCPSVHHHLHFELFTLTARSAGTEEVLYKCSVTLITLLVFLCEFWDIFSRVLPQCVSLKLYARYS